MRLIALVAVAALSSLAAAGCGGGLDCSFTACGGDPTGTWNMDGACADFSALEAQLHEACASIDVNVRSDASGTLSFSADHTYTQDLTITATGTVVVPAVCFEGNPVQSCNDLEGDTLSCTGTPDTSCRCMLSSSDSTGGGGTWAVDGTTITLDDGSPDQLSFCVDGDSLKAKTIPATQDDSAVVYVLSRASD